MKINSGIVVYAVKTLFTIQKPGCGSVIPEATWDRYIWVHTHNPYSAFGKYSDPLTFPHFVMLQPYSKMYSIKISHLHKYADPLLCWSTFGSDCSLESSWVWHYKLGTLVFGEVLPLISADPLKLCQVECGALLHSYFQVSPEMVDRVQFRALAESPKDIETCPEATPALSWLCAEGSCPIRRWTFAPVWGPENLHQGTVYTLLRSSFLRSWLVSQSLPLKNIPKAWCCHYHASP